MKLAIAFAALILPCVVQAENPLLDRLMNIEDPSYNDALSEMQDLPAPAKAKLSRDLAQALRSRKNAEERANAASALGDLCAAVPENAKILAKGLKDKSEFVRQGAISGLGRCGPKDPAVIPSLTAALKDKNETVRVMARSKLEEFGTPEAQAALKPKSKK